MWRQPGPIEIVARGEVRAPPADVWRVLGDFGTEHRWASQLRLCRRSTAHVAVGTVRSCILARPLMGRSEVEEELVEYEPGRMLAYRLRGTAGPFRTAEGRWTIRPGGAGTLVEVGGRFQPRNIFVGALFGRLARRTAERAAARALRDLAAYLQ